MTGEDKDTVGGGANIVGVRSTADAADDAVRQQYEIFPYPPLEVGSESQRLLTGSPSHFLEIDHFVFGGRRDWSMPFRALVAGGGTGDAAIMLGQQLRERGCPADIVYLDISTASRDIARNRARERGLENIAFLDGDLLGLPDRGLAPFDYIDCCGVLHHLDDPAEGLRALAAVLAPAGGIGMMLYGALGRTGIYDIQSIMRRIASPAEDQAARLPVLRALLDQLPGSNRLVRNPLASHATDQDDAELVDKFLHPRDQAYTVGGIAALCASAGLRVASFAPTGRYDPATYITDAALRARLGGLDAMAQAMVAELIAGNIAKHIFYAVRIDNAADTVARHATPDAIPVLRQSDGPTLAKRLTPESAFHATFGDLTIVATPPPLAAAIMRRIDGETCLEDIYFALAAQTPGLGWRRFIAEFRELHGAMHGLLNAQYLRYPA